MSLADRLPDLKEHLRGANPRIRSADTMVKTTPPGAGSRLLRMERLGPVVEAAERQDGAAYRDFVSPRSQVLNQTPALRHC